MKHSSILSVLVLLITSCASMDSTLLENPALRDPIFDPPEVKAVIDSYQIRAELTTRDTHKGDSYTVYHGEVVPYEHTHTPPNWASFDLGYGIHYDTRKGFTFDLRYFLPENQKDSFIINLKAEHFWYNDRAGDLLVYERNEEGFFKNHTPLFIDEGRLRFFAFKAGNFGGPLILDTENQRMYEKTDDEPLLYTSVHKEGETDVLYQRYVKNNPLAFNFGNPDLTMRGKWIDSYTYEIEDYLRIKYLGDKIEFYPLEWFPLIGTIGPLWGFERTEKWTFMKIEDSYYFFNDSYQGAEFTVIDNTIVYSIRNEDVYEFTLNP